MTKTNSSIRRKPFTLQSQKVVAIDFQNLRTDDIILIGTLNTSYRFVITSEPGLQGSLTGDTPDSFYPEAMLIGSLMNLGERVHLLMAKLEIQAQALFFVKQDGQLIEVLTSAITSLCCVRPI